MSFPVMFSLRSRPNTGAAAAVLLIQDAFNDTDAVALTSHTIGPTNTPAATWGALFTTVPVINTNKLQGTATNSSAHVDSGLADFTAVVDFTYVTGELNTGLVVRSIDTSNYYRLLLLTTTSWVLQRRQAGSNTTLATVTVSTLVNGQTYELKIVCSGSTLSVYIDGTLLTQQTGQTFNQTGTKCGVHMSNTQGTASRLDNFRVYSGSF